MKVIISGYGKMGHMIEKILNERGITCAGASEDITSTDPELAKECICIDFTTPQAIRANYPFLAQHFKGVVIGTTGWDDIREEFIECFKKHGTTMIYASNFSIGVNVLFALTQQLSRMLAQAGGYMPYIEEKHHCQKLDRPSGTAKTLAEIVTQETGQNPDMASVRCGEIPGIHTIGFEGINDRITLTHEAFSREGFATGAVEAAIKADTLPCDVYDFKNIIFQ